MAPTPTPSEASTPELESTADAAATDTQAAASATTAVDEIGQHAPLVSAMYDPATTPPLGDFDVARLAAAAKTLDPEMDCPTAMVPESLENVAEVLRIERGCDVIEYVQLGGRSVRELRAELFASDETVYAVGLPPADLVPFASQTTVYGNPPSPFNEDAYGRGEWWHLGVLDADTLWEPDGWRYTTAGTGTQRVPGWGDGEVIVAVIEPGVAQHRDLRRSMIDVDDCHHRDITGHGTHVAGLIGAQQGNGQDVAGIAHEAKILPIFLPLGGAVGTGECATMTLTQAIQIARRQGADVINMSFGWGIYGNPVECERDPHSHECVPGTDAAEAQLRLAQLENIVAVAAAGNCPSSLCESGGRTRHYPAAYPGVLVVAATGPDNQTASFSKSNEDVDIAAPGKSIFSTVPLLTCRAVITGIDSREWGPHGCGVGNPPTECPPGTPYPDGPLDQPAECALAVVPLSGASMAAPLVSGVVAHMKARYPRATQDQILSALFDTADPPGSGYSHDYGHGLIQPKAALEALDQVFRSSPATVSAGGVHSCLLRTSGVIECWGQVRQSDVPSGEFLAVSAGGHHTCALRRHQTTGYGTVECWSNPGGGASSSIREASGAWFSAVSSGEHHSCGIIVGGTVRCWGRDSDGQLNAPSGQFTAVSAGHNHSCGLKSDRTIACWGGWGFGESDAPPGQFLEVSAGQLHSCGLRTDSTIECWGDIDAGRLDAPPGQFLEVSAGQDHTCARRTDGTIECWGFNSDGQTDAPPGRFISVSAGEDHSCGIRDNGAIECWGSYLLGQADAPEHPDDTAETDKSGDETDDGEAPPSYGGERFSASDGTFSAVSAGSDHSCGLHISGSIECWDVDPNGRARWFPEGSFSAVSAGDGHSCGLRTDGTIECWGRDFRDDVPKGEFSSVSTGYEHSCGLRTNGAVECWGNGWLGELGQFVAPDTDAPGGAFSAASAGYRYSCGLRGDGTIECWGSDGHDTLGLDAALNGLFSAVDAGLRHTCGLRTNGRVECWGANWYGQADAPDGVFSAVSAGGVHSCGLRVDGTVECWGYNGSGQANPPDGTFSAVSAGGVHSCGLRVDGTVECWGYNRHSWIDSPEGAFGEMSAGLSHACGLRTNGRVECWGYNGAGQADAPGGQYGSVSAGGVHSCGLRVNGEIECWGYTLYEMLDASFLNGPTDVPEGTFSAVSSGYWHACGLRTDGRVECWGGNSHWQADPPRGTFSAVSAGNVHSCGLRTDGTIECWGANDSGQSDAPDGAFSAVSTGGQHSCGHRIDGTVSCWGSNHLGQSDVPDGVFNAVSAGYERTCGLRTDGTIECWGGSRRFARVDPPEGAFSAVSVGSRHACGMRGDGTIQCWGVDP